MKIAIFPGSFDPITVGHEDVIRRASKIFDRVIVAIGVNPNKKKGSHFDVETREKMINDTFSDSDNIVGDVYTGLTVNYCKALGVRYLIRGLRTSSDFEFERSVEQINKQLDDSIETVFLFSSPEHVSLSSSLVRELIKLDAPIDKFVPEGVLKVIKLLK